MVKIRLSKIGKKGDITYRIVAIDERKKTTGKNLEILGFWYPKKEQLIVKKDLIKKWVEKGAKITSPVANLLK